MALPHRDRLPASTTASRLTSVVSFANAALGNKIPTFSFSLSPWHVRAVKT